MMDPNLTRRQDERTGRVSFFFLLFFFVNKNRAHENANEIRIHSKGKARQKWRHGHFRSRFRRTRIVGVRLCVCVRVCVCVCVDTDKPFRSGGIERRISRTRVSRRVAQRRRPRTAVAAAAAANETKRGRRYIFGRPLTRRLTRIRFTRSRPELILHRLLGDERK